MSAFRYLPIVSILLGAAALGGCQGEEPDVCTTVRNPPQLTVSVARKAIGTTLQSCVGDQATSLKPSKYTINEPYVRLVAFDGLALPAGLVIEAGASPARCIDGGKIFLLKIDGTWYSARSVDCMQND